MDSQLASSKETMREDEVGDPRSGEVEPKPGLRLEKSVNPKVLIVDDDVSLSKFLSRELIAKHFTVAVCHDGETGYADLMSSDYDLVILDLNLPKMDGIAFLTQIRTTRPRLPILVLTARDRTEDLVHALEKGADDYLIKPFSFLELIARVRALQRRNVLAPAAPSNVNELTLSREEYRVMRGGRRIDLTPREFAILEYLIKHVGRPVSRAMLIQDVWNIPYDPSSNIVDVYMKYLRDKVDLEGEVKLIRTVRGVGYVLSND
jgi:two-component system copper resistance phosphate regulon response regulator CusR